MNVNLHSPNGNQQHMHVMGLLTVEILRQLSKDICKQCFLMALYQVLDTQTCKKFMCCPVFAESMS